MYFFIKLLLVILPFCAVSGIACFPLEQQLTCVQSYSSIRSMRIPAAYFLSCPARWVFRELLDLAQPFFSMCTEV